jgi:pimeloyl-ACP methyl ester carboxylesterase
MRLCMSTKELRFDDGAATVVETWGEKGPAIVCVHGMTSSRKAWMRLAERLAGRYRVIAYDQRGHGDAAHVRGPMQLDRHVADLQSVLSEVGSDVIALLGHSWGGAVVVLAGPISRARGVIAIDPVLNVHSGTWRQDYLEDAETLFALPWQARELSVRASLKEWHPLDVDGKLHAVRNMTAEPIARLGTENRVDEGGWNILGAVENYPKPLLIFAAGPDDSVMSPADVNHLKTRGGSRVRVAEFPEEGHNLHRTAFDAYAAQVEAFLAGL